MPNSAIQPAVRAAVRSLLAGLSGFVLGLTPSPAPAAPPVAATGPSTADVLRESDFADPPVSARPGAFWPWLNGHVSLPRLAYELEQMKDKGMSGADIWDVRAHADPQKMIPAGAAFLSDPSLDAIAHTVKQADRLGLRLGMIAASGWNAGGTWVQPPDASMGLYHSETPIEGPAKVAQQPLPFPKVPAECPKDASGRPLHYRDVAVLAVPAPKGDKSPVPAAQVVDLRKYVDDQGRLTWDAPAGTWTVLRFVMTNTGQPLIVPSPNSVGPMIDFLNPDSTRMHFRHMVDRLESKLGSLKGSPLKYLEVDSMELSSDTPWTAGITDAFARHHGYDPLPYLPVLMGFTVTSDDVSWRFLYDWRKTVSDLFIDSHYRTGSRLLNDHGLQLAAEAGGPGAPIWDSCPVDALKALGAVDVLRGEFWPKHRNMWLVKEISSAAHIYGKRVVDAESFTSWRHWQDGPYYLKQMADNALAEGLNHFTFHTFTHSPDEAGLPGFAYHAGSHFNPNVTWWPMARPFVDYLSRCSHALQQGLFVADVCYYYGDHAPNFVPSKHAGGFSPGPGYDYDVVNTEALLTRMSVGKDGRLTLPDGMSYALLVLPDREDMDLDVLRKLDRLVRAGATVVGPKPTRTGTLTGYPDRDRQVAELADRVWSTGRVISDRPVADVLRAKGITRDFAFASPDPRTRLDYVHRRTDDADVYFVTNKNERWEDATCTFRVTGRRPQLWHPETGAVRDLPVYESAGGVTRVPLHLAPAESVFVVFRGEAPKTHFTRLELPAEQPPHLKPTLLPHTATPAGPLWLSDGARPPSAQQITFDLGAPRDLTALRVWNYNENVRGYVNLGIKDLDVLTSPDNQTWRKAGSFTLKDADTDEDKNYSQDLPLAEAKQARYVRLKVKSNQNKPRASEGISPCVGLSRIQFLAPDPVDGVTVSSVSSGTAFDPASDSHLGTLHPAAELLADPAAGAPLLRAWHAGTYTLHDSAGQSRAVSVPSLPAPLPLDGPWTLSFPKGWRAPESLPLDKLTSWTDSPNPDVKHFSGTATYRTTFTLPEGYVAKDTHLELDLGAVQHAAVVTLNGKPLATLWKPPYTVDVTPAARPGPNELVVQVANNWHNRLVGDAALPPDQRLTRTNMAHRFNPKMPLQPSGLLGPVRILPARILPLK